jgi:hypothetical protein
MRQKQLTLDSKQTLFGPLFRGMSVTEETLPSPIRRAPAVVACFGI